jgi:hypothetical protein
MPSFSILHLLLRAESVLDNETRSSFSGHIQRRVTLRMIWMPIWNSRPHTHRVRLGIRIRLASSTSGMASNAALHLPLGLITLE